MDPKCLKSYDESFSHYSSYESYQDDEQFIEAMDDCNFIANNFRVSIGCISSIPPISIAPKLPSYNTTSPHRESLLLVQVPKTGIRLNDDLRGELRSLAIRLEWPYRSPLVDGEVVLVSSAPIVVAAHNHTWHRSAKNIYRHQVAMSHSSNYFYGVFADVLTLWFELAGKSDITLSIIVRTDEAILEKQDLRLALKFNKSIRQSLQINRDIRIGNKLPAFPARDDYISVYYDADLSAASPFNASTIQISLPGCAFNPATDSWHRFVKVKDVKQVKYSSDATRRQTRNKILKKVKAHFCRWSSRQLLLKLYVMSICRTFIVDSIEKIILSEAKTENSWSDPFFVES